ncbi:MAG: hypothetical protein JST68_00505 [Bacteroidetes bacterium]|nr:hypothetical protein [Bacteroidota bacterium]
MKKIGGVLALLSVNMVGTAQSFDEWFRQKKVELSYMKGQVAALEAYIKVTEDGYRIVQQGTDIIGAIKSRDFDLHSEQFKSLSKVQPAIGQSAIMQTVTDIYDKINEMAGDAKAKATILPGWSIIINEQFDGLVTNCFNSIACLKNLLTDGQTEMTDQVRLSEIEEICSRIKHDFEAAVLLRNGVGILSQNINP